MGENRTRTLDIERKIGGKVQAITASATAQIDEDGHIDGPVQYAVGDNTVKLTDEEKNTLKGLLALSQPDDTDVNAEDEEDEDEEEISEEDFEEANPEEEEEEDPKSA